MCNVEEEKDIPVDIVIQQNTSSRSMCNLGTTCNSERCIGSSESRAVIGSVAHKENSLMFRLKGPDNSLFSLGSARGLGAFFRYSNLLSKPRDSHAIISTQDHDLLAEIVERLHQEMGLWPR